MNRRQRAAQVGADGGRLARAQAALLLHQPVQRRAADELHPDARRCRRRVSAPYTVMTFGWRTRASRRPSWTTREGSLRRHRQIAAGGRDPEQLEGDLAIEMRVPGAIDLAEAAVPDLFQEAQVPPHPRRRWRGCPVRTTEVLSGAEPSMQCCDFREDAELTDHDLLVRARPWTPRPTSRRACPRGSRRRSGRAATRYPASPRAISSASFTRARLAARRAAFGTGATGGLRHLLGCVAQFHGRDDQLAVGVGEARQRGLVAFHGLQPHRVLERRRTEVFVLRVELGGHRPAADPPDVIADAVQHGLPEVGLQGALAAHLERLQMLKRLQHRFLDNVLGVGEVARPRAAAGHATSAAAAARSGRRGRRWRRGRRPGPARAG